MTRRLLFVAIALVGLLALSCGGADGDKAASAGVPMLGGNAARTGVNPGPGVELSPQLLWRFEADSQVYASPAVADGAAYVSSVDGHVYSLDADTGQERWSFDTGGKILSSPAVVAGMVYVTGGLGDLPGSDEEQEGFVHALDAATGEERWTFSAGKWLHSSPAVADGLVYVGGGEGYLYALDAVTGAERWRFQTGGALYSSPAVAGGVVYIGDGRGYLHALDASTGQERWRKGVGVVGSCPAVVDRVVYVGTSYTAGFGGDDWNDWDEIRRGGYVQALDTATGDYLWRFETRETLSTSPALAEGLVYVGTHGWQLYALDAATGQQRWQFKTVRGIYSCASVVNDLVYVGSGDFKTPGYVYALDANTGEERWRFEVAGEVWSSPAVVDGTLYVGSGDSYVYAIVEE